MTWMPEFAIKVCSAIFNSQKLTPMFSTISGERFVSTFHKRESVEPSCYSSHGLRPSHCPVLLNEQHRSPRRYVYNSLSYSLSHQTDTAMTLSRGMRINTSRGHLPLQSSLTIPWSLRSFNPSRTKRQVNAFICFHFPPPHLGRIETVLYKQFQNSAWVTIPYKTTFFMDMAEKIATKVVKIVKLQTKGR